MKRFKNGVKYVKSEKANCEMFSISRLWHYIGYNNNEEEKEFQGGGCKEVPYKMLSSLFTCTCITPMQQGS